MLDLVSVQPASPMMLAAVRRRVVVAEIAAAWKPALDQVWAFLRGQPGPRENGRNVFLYHHPFEGVGPMDVDFGVEVTRAFDPAGEVRPVQTPGGLAATAVLVGPYSGIPRTHAAIHAWAKENGRSFAGWSWEVYGHWTDDPAKLETTVQYLLK